MNLSKAGQMEVHRIIDDQIPSSHSKFLHSSEGSGRGWVLVITKKGFEGPDEIKKKQERQEKHKALLKQMD